MASNGNMYTMPEEEGLQDSSDILLDILPAGLAAGIAGWAGKQFFKKGTPAADKLAELKSINSKVAPSVVTKAASSAAKTKYNPALHGYHGDAAKELGYKNVDDMYDDFYKKYDVVDSYSPMYMEYAKGTDALARMQKAGIPEEKYVQALAMDKTLDAIRNGKVREKGYMESKNNFYDDLEDQWDYVDKATGKTYSDGMSREEFLELDNPEFAEAWKASGYKTLPDDIVSDIASGKLSVDKAFGSKRDKRALKTDAAEWAMQDRVTRLKKAEAAADNEGISLGDILSRELK